MKRSFITTQFEESQLSVNSPAHVLLEEPHSDGLLFVGEPHTKSNIISVGPDKLEDKVKEEEVSFIDCY